jgi:hypothetical protein
VLVVRETTSELEHTILTILFIVGAETPTVGKEGGIVARFPLDVLMVHSSALAVTTDSECLTCGAFSLCETICFGSLESIADCFGSLSLSPKESDSGTTFKSHDRGLHQGVLHDFKRRRGLQPPFLPEAWHGGYSYSHRIHTMAGERFDRSGHDNGSIMGTHTAVEHRPPPRLMSCFSRRARSVSPHSASLC